MSSVRTIFRSRSPEFETLERRMAEAETFEEWFALAKDEPATAKAPKGKAEELQKAQALHEEQERKAANEHQQTENMLLTVESMDKGALEEYARKYDVELDKRLGIAKLRAEVSTLIEQFGAR